LFHLLIKFPSLAFYSIIIAVFFEAIAVSWLYGIKRISEDVKEMLGTKPGKFWIVTWCVAAPVFLGVRKINMYCL
jgi:solute carrier family 6 dopamine transporter-like protein 3